MFAMSAQIAVALAGDFPPYAVPRSAVHDVSAGARAYRLFVSTPPGYSNPENASRKYPVVFLNDGELFFLVAAGAPLLSYYNGVIGETILVGVSYAVGDDPIASRQRDYTPVRDDAISPLTGGAKEYLNVMKTAIIPAIENEYRTDPARRILAGHSFGAVFGLYALFSEPDLFSDYILISPSLWYANHAIAGIEARYAAAHADLKARVYLAVGDLEGPGGGFKAVDMVNDEVAFAARLRSRNYQGFILRDEVLGPGVNHATAFTPAYLRALEWISPPH
jgi:predicted alpha/beta superfamily hydrolase